MKYYKVIENDEVMQFAKQPNNIIPSFAVKITAEEYAQLKADFAAKQATIADYVEKVNGGEITIEEVPEEYRAEVEPKTDDETTEADCISALAELGVQ